MRHLRLHFLTSHIAHLELLCLITGEGYEDFDATRPERRGSPVSVAAFFGSR